jgi:Ca-activated chloride channel homolog
MIPRLAQGHAWGAPARSKFLVVFPLLAAVACAQSKPIRPPAPVAATASPPAPATAGVTKERSLHAAPLRDSPMNALPTESPTAGPRAPRPQGEGKKAASGQSLRRTPASAPAAGIAGAGRASTTSPQAAPRALRAPGASAPVSPLLREEREFDTEAYAPLTDNAFLSVKEHPLSTFSSDVDTASYSNARRFLVDGRLPPRDSIRVEEWINYFSYDYAPPEGKAPVAVHTEVSDCPWRPGHRLVRIGLKTRPIEQAAVAPRNLVFLVDVSGSMQQPNKLPLLKSGLGMLARTLRPQDRVAIVVYAGASGLALPSTAGNHQGEILGALEALQPGGSTNGADGIRLAYAVAREHFLQGGINRVILATDGDFNVGVTNQGELQTLIQEKAKSGVFLTVLGFGDGNLKDSTMELLADKGNGNYAYVDSAFEARKVLVREAGATLVTVAKDVKLQVEFNPARVASYRLVGYENRLLAKEDFNDDRKDAGDMGAGHAVTALYEVVPKGAETPAGQAPAVGPLRYQKDGVLAEAAQRPELLTVSVRYKLPNESESSKLALPVLDRNVPFAEASQDHRFAAAVAEVAQVLRGSTAAGNATLDSARSIAASAIGADPAQTRRELLAFIDHAKRFSAH